MQSFLNNYSSPSCCRQAGYQMALSYNFANVMQGEIKKDFWETEEVLSPS